LLVDRYKKAKEKALAKIKKSFGTLNVSKDAKLVCFKIHLGKKIPNNKSLAYLELDNEIEKGNYYKLFIEKGTT